MKRTFLLALALSVATVSCGQTYQVIDLGAQPGFDVSEPTGINNLGQVSGFSSRNNGTFRRAFFYDTPGCSMVDVGAAAPQASLASSEAAAINDSAMVVGAFRRPDGRSRAFSFHQGVFRDLGGSDRLDLAPRRMGIARACACGRAGRGAPARVARLPDRCRTGPGRGLNKGET